MTRVRFCSAGMRRLKHLPAALAATPVGRWGPPPEVVAGWGAKPSGRRAEALAARLAVPCWRIEDGLIRSLGLGVAGAEPFSFAVDDLGVHYDATRPSRIEEMLRAGSAVDAAAARALISRVVAAGIGKYNDTWDGPALPPRTRPRVLLVDQTAGDLSIGLGLADAQTFRRMAAAAAAENPGAELVVRVHPDVLAGRRRGYLAHDPPAGATLHALRCNPYRLLSEVDRVYVVSSQLGYEALLAGKPVTCFGAPFYAGWGLTDDRVALPRRGVVRSIEELFAIAAGQYCRHVDPETGERCDLATLIGRIEDHARTAAANRGRWWCLGMRWWRRPTVRAFLSGAERISFAGSAAGARRAGARQGDRVLIWGQQGPDGAADLAAGLGTGLVRMEDGFVRSVGLGSDLVQPASLVVDDRGIYFDPQAPSRLEEILANHEFTAAELERGRQLIILLRQTGVTKYNAGASQVAITAPSGRSRILVPGQVEDDASIRLGCRDVRTNAGLLQAVRAARPQAWIVFKPHPDVLAGNRRGAVDAATLATCADQVVTDAPMDAMLRQVEAVHTMTSLTGFEALVRGLEVACYGQPFYSGWGLTTDRHVCTRRGRSIPIEALVLATLVLYPRYRAPAGSLFTGPEVVIARLAAQRTQGNPAIGAWWLRRQLRKLGNVLRAGR